MRNNLIINAITAILAGTTLMATTAEKLVIKGSDTLGAKLVPQLKEGYVAADNDTTFEIAAEDPRRLSPTSSPERRTSGEQPPGQRAGSSRSLRQRR